MAREVVWRRVGDASFNWTEATEGNRHMYTLTPGETLIRLVLSVRFWARVAAQGSNIPPERLYVPYAFGIFWNDGISPVPNLVYPLSSADDYPDNWLHLERFTLRDAYTPAKYTGVNIGWQDSRPDMQVDIKARRLSDRADGNPCQILFTWQGFSGLLGDAMVLQPLVTTSALIMLPA